MRGDIFYEVYGVRNRDGKYEESPFGNKRTRQEAEEKVQSLKEGHRWSGGDWKKYWDDFEVRELHCLVDFEIPPEPTPRERYSALCSQTDRQGWPKTHVTIVDEQRKVAVFEYHRNYGFLSTFEPFRQNGHDYALIAPNYTKTTVVDLECGEIIAEEADEYYEYKGEQRKEEGFCPVGFWVPDWWDVHDGSILPGSRHWDEDLEWPTGDFGFVWGCYWGDDTSWKVQFLDLSKISEGVISRDERFGYVELATQWPTFFVGDASQKTKHPPHFIHVWKESGKVSVRFAVDLTFDLASGAVNSWAVDQFTRDKGDASGAEG